MTIETGREGTPFADRTVEIVSYEEAFKRELVEFAAAIEAGRAPRTDVIEGLHDIALRRAIVTSHITRQPVDLPSALPDWAQPYPATPATVGPAG